MTVSIFLKIFALIGLILLSPVILISCILIIFEDGMPIFFVQDRIGKNEKTFKLFKIRTMIKNAPITGTHNISKNHLLRFGNMLRRLKIDELPQVINYILGDLNLIGPRPGMPSQIQLLSIRKEKKIFQIKPGITGLAQILGYDMSNPKLLSDIDKLYIDKKSIRLDLMIFFATFFNFIKTKIREELKNEINLIKYKNYDV